MKLLDCTTCGMGQASIEGRMRGASFSLRFNDICSTAPQDLAALGGLRVCGLRFFVYCFARQAQPEAWAKSRASDPKAIRSMMAVSGRDDPYTSCCRSLSLGRKSILGNIGCFFDGRVLKRSCNVWLQCNIGTDSARSFVNQQVKH